MSDTTELRRLAEAATPGPWQRGGLTQAIPRRPPTTSVWGPTPEGRQSGSWIAKDVLAANAAYIAAMHPKTTLALLDEIAELRSAVITFCAPWAAGYSKMMGLPPRHLHAAHYDLLAKCGARMVDFVRHDDEQ